MISKENHYITGIQNDDESIFEEAFNEFYEPLHVCAMTLVRDKATADEIVQNIFVHLWESRKRLVIRHSLRAYLYRSVYHEVTSLKEKNDRKQKYIFHLSKMREDAPEHHHIESKELEYRVSQALMDLPEGCRTIFQLSRYEEMKYHEIADHLEISIKTVEGQMTKALKILRAKFADYLKLMLPLIIFCIIDLKP